MGAMIRTLGITVVTLGLITAGCAREDARADVPADLTGRYTFVGADTTGKIPWAARAELTLAGDSTFEFDLRIRVKDDDEREAAVGTYQVAGDRLRLVSSNPNEKETFELKIRGDSLVLDAGWVAMAALRLVGVPRPVLVRER